MTAAWHKANGTVAVHLVLTDCWTRDQGHAQDLSLGAKSEGLKAKSGGRVLAEGQQPPPHQLGGLGERCELPGGVRGGAPTARRFFTIFSTQDGLS